MKKNNKVFNSIGGGGVSHLNSAELQKNEVTLSIEKNSFNDNGDGMITFPKGLTITDNTEQHNGTKYDIKSMDVSEFKNKLTINHSDRVEDIVGTTQGLRKRGDRVTIDGIRFAIQESALARYAYNMIKGGFLTDFSIETMGPWPDNDGVYFNSKLVGLSAVVVGNNKSAAINSIVKNTIEEAKKDGLDTSVVESEYLSNSEEITTQENTMKFVIVKNSKSYAVTLKYKNSVGEETEVVVQPGATVEVPEAQGEVVQKQIDTAVEPKAEEKPVAKQEESIADVVKNAVAPLLDQVTKLEKQVFDNSAQEPMFKKATSKQSASSEISKMSYLERHGEQINAAWEMFKNHSAEASRKLESINTYNFEKLQETGKVSNAITLSDLGNFVISPELLTTIEGHRSNFSAIINATNWQETLSLQMSYLKRSGDISMTAVEMCDDGADGNLKPISDYGTTVETVDLEELAAVTPVCNAATRFFAADLLGDVAAGYRNDYDRKRAQLVVARLQQAINETGNQVAYNKSSAVTPLLSWINTMTLMQEEIMNGTFIFNQQTYGELLGAAVVAGISGPLASLFTTGDVPMIAGRPYIVVPNELMPSLNTNQTKSFTVDGSAVTIREAVFYADLSKFKGRTSGGLKYDLSTEAAYEENSTVKSAFQRNELVLRGSFFRGGAFTDNDMVVGLVAAGIS